MLTVSRMVRRSKRNTCRLPQSLCNLPGLAKRITTQSDRKFLATQPGNNVVRPQIGLEQFSELDESGIAGIMAVVVIHLLEVVEIENQQRVLRPGWRPDRLSAPSKGRGKPAC